MALLTQWSGRPAPKQSGRVRAPVKAQLNGEFAQESDQRKAASHNLHCTPVEAILGRLRS